ncbi:MAG: sulfatase-like hydrolase/transferase [Caldilineaceae bacterium]|nr:sulfatase-like hydrolase/transferase [Caldilineaceae bacterium]
MARSPNILVLMSDQQRLDTVSAYGLNNIVHTPHIDSIAQRGVRFDNAFTVTAGVVSKKSPRATTATAR